MVLVPNFSQPPWVPLGILKSNNLICVSGHLVNVLAKNFLNKNFIPRFAEFLLIFSDYTINDHQLFAQLFIISTI